MSKERPIILDPPVGDPYLHRVRWWDHVGRKRQKNFRGHDARSSKAARAQAKRYVDDLIAKMQRGERTTSGKTTIDQMFDEWWPIICARIEKSTANGSYGPSFEHRILPYMGTAPLATVDGEMLDKFVAHLVSKGVGVQTIRNTMTALSSMLQTAVEWRRIPYNPARAVKLPPIPDSDRQALTVDDMAAIAAGARLDRDKALIWFAGWVGRRKTDVFELTWENVDTGPLELPEGHQASYRMWQKKLKRWDTVPLLEPARLALLWWREVTPYPEPHSPVFPTSTGTSLTRQASSHYRRHWLPACARAGMLHCATARCRAPVPTDEETAQRIGVDPGRGRANLDAWLKKLKAHEAGRGPKPRGPRPIEPWACAKCGGSAFVNPVFHELRHGFGSNVAAATGDLSITADLGGWSSTTMLERRYRHKVDQAQREAVAKVNRAATDWLK